MQAREKKNDSGDVTKGHVEMKAIKRKPHRKMQSGNVLWDIIFDRPEQK
jgi:hypothetical protein